MSNNKVRPKPLKYKNMQASYSAAASFIEGAKALNLFAQAASDRGIAPEDVKEMNDYMDVIIDTLKMQGLPNMPDTSVPKDNAMQRMAKTLEASINTLEQETLPGHSQSQRLAWITEEIVVTLEGITDWLPTSIQQQVKRLLKVYHQHKEK